MPFIRQSVTGVIYLTSNTRRKRLPSAIATCPLPLVTVAQTPFDNTLDLVMRDNRQASALAIEFLIEQGHQNIAYISGEAGCRIREQRLLGYQGALLQPGLPFRAELPRPVISKLMPQELPPRDPLERDRKITALLCHSSHDIIDGLSAIHQVGRTVGKKIFLTQQVSLVGFEDMLQINLSSPSFTYVSSARDEASRQAVEVMLSNHSLPANISH